MISGSIGARAVAVSVLVLALAGCGGGVTDDSASRERAIGKKIKIGVSFDSLREERWKRDRDFFIAEAEKRGAECVFRSAGGDARRQIEQCEILLAEGIDVLVVVPRSATATASAVGKANRQGVPVLAYARLIRDCDLDAFITFDSVRIGQQQAEFMVNRKKGRYILLGGAPDDNNSLLLREGQMEVLKPHIESGAITIVAEQWVEGWSPEVATQITEVLLTELGEDVDVILAPNDGTAGGVIQVLESRGLAGKILVSGQDAELEACRRILKGTQSMTTYGSVKDLATRAAELAIRLGKGEDLEHTLTVNNGKIDVPAILLEPVLVDASNLVEVLTADGYHTREALLGE